MRFYTNQHKFYCGIDLHATGMYVCVINEKGDTEVHKNIRTEPAAFLALISPYREDVVIGVECMFCWYWLSDLCRDEGISFVLGHALYMKAIHGGKAKNDRLDSQKLAMMLKGGMFPLAYAYPREMRATRDLMRRRLFFVNKRAELLSHVQMTHQQYNLKAPGGKLKYRANRKGVELSFDDSSAKRMVESDLKMIEHYTDEIGKLEWFITKHTRKDTRNALSLSLLKTVPGIGDVLSHTMLYEIHQIERFPTVQQFASYSRLIRPEKSSMGKRTGSSGRKIGNHHLKWAFSEATVLYLRASDDAKKYLLRLQKKNSKARSLSIFSHRMGKAVYFMLSKKEPFDERKFFMN